MANRLALLAHWLVPEVFVFIHQVTQVVQDRTCAPYDNVLIFTVLEDEFQMAPPEMYFFQCLDAPVCMILLCLFRLDINYSREGFICMKTSEGVS